MRFITTTKVINYSRHFIKLFISTNLYNTVCTQKMVRLNTNSKNPIWGLLNNSNACQVQSKEWIMEHYATGQITIPSVAIWDALASPVRK